MPHPPHSWKHDERRNWEYGDLRLRALKCIMRAGGGMQAISLRGHLLLDVAITQLLRCNVSPNIGDLARVPFGQKLKKAEKCGLISPDIRSILFDISRMRNACVHEVGVHPSFRQVYALSVRGREAGIEDRFPLLKSAEPTWRSAAMSELADHLFNPAFELADLCVELFCHVVFWNYTSFDLVSLGRTLDELD